MSPEELRTFIASKMSISRIYQPAIILTLLENNGSATVDLIAQKCSELKGGSAASYSPRLTKYPKEALTKHGVIEVGRSEFKLKVDLGALQGSTKSDLIELCKKRVTQVK